MIFIIYFRCKEEAYRIIDIIPKSGIYFAQQLVVNLDII